MSKSKYVLKRKCGSRKKKHVRFNLTHSRKLSRPRTLRRSSNLGVALKKTNRRSRVKSGNVARGKYRTKTRGRTRTRTRLGGFRGGYGPGGGPVGAPWDGGENVPGYSVQGLPSANHYSYNKAGVGVGGIDPAISTRTIGGSQRGGGLMDLVPQGIKTAIEVSRGAIGSTYNSLTMNSAVRDVSSLPTKQYIDNESNIVYPNNPINLDKIIQNAGEEAANV